MLSSAEVGWCYVQWVSRESGTSDNFRFMALTLVIKTNSLSMTLLIFMCVPLNCGDKHDYPIIRFVKIYRLVFESCCRFYNVICV